MHERDFDLRLTDWLREGPSGASSWVLEAVVDYARRHPRRGFLGVRWSDALQGLTLGRPAAPALRLGILFALLALAITLAGIVYLGSQNRAVAPTPTTAPAFACPAGSTPDQPGPVGQARPEVRLGWPMAFDRQSGRLVLVTRSYSFGMIGMGVWTFDVCTNTWHEAQARVPGAQALAYDVDSDLTVIFAEDLVSAYDVDTDTSTAKAKAPVSGSWLAAYNAVTGLLVARDMGTSRMWTYDVDADAWRELAQHGDIPPSRDLSSQLLAYDESVDRLVLLDPDDPRGESTYEFDPRTSTWSWQRITPPGFFFFWADHARDEIAYDEGTTRTVVFDDGRMAAYDATAHEWHLVFGEPWYQEPQPVNGSAMAYDSVNGRLVVVGPDAQRDGVRAFDLRTRTWLELLAPSGR